MSNFVFILYGIATAGLIGLIIILVRMVRQQKNSLSALNPAVHPRQSPDAIKPDSFFESKNHHFSTPQTLGRSSAAAGRNQTFPAVFDKLDGYDAASKDFEQQALQTLENVQRQLDMIQKTLDEQESLYLNQAVDPDDNNKPQPGVLIKSQLGDLNYCEHKDASLNYLKQIASQFRNLEQYIKARLFGS